MAPDEPTTEEPTPEQVENARRAGWDPDQGPPPGGWEAHGDPVEPLSSSTDAAAELTEEERAALGLGEALP